jgi:hypothetical protein
VPRHWWIAVGSSDAKDRKKEVKDKLDAKKKPGRSLHSFWKADDGSLYAIIKGDEIDDVREDIKALKVMKMEDVPD